jgi:hypothetical protein
MDRYDGTFGTGYGMVKERGGYGAKRKEDGSWGTFYQVDETSRFTSEKFTGDTPLGNVQDGVLGGPAPSATANWVDGTSTPGQATINRRAPLTPLGAVLLTAPEDQASLDTKGRGDFAAGNRTVVNRTTGRTREDEEDELRRGAILLR